MVNFIMKEFAEKNDQHVPIKSATAQPTIPGYIYIEAHFPRDVEKICKKSVFYRSDIRMVSVKDVLAVLGCTSLNRCPKPESWVRVKRGPYAGDIGYVREVIQSDRLDEHNSNGVSDDAIVSVIPRIHDPVPPKIKHQVGAKRKQQPCSISLQKRQDRPQPAFFNQNTIITKMKIAGFDEGTIAKRQPIVKVTAQGQSEARYRGNIYINGLTDLVVPIQILNLESSNPTADELKLWAQCEDLQARLHAMHSLAQFRSFIWPGDRVEAISGPYQKLQGEVLDTDGAVITVDFPMPHDGALAQVMTTTVRKIFKAGDYVQVMGGTNDGKEGLVIRVSDDEVILIESVTNNEVSADFVLM